MHNGICECFQAAPLLLLQKDVYSNSLKYLTL